MRIEVIVGSDDPIIFPLKSSRVTIGAADNCDIVLPYEGISRRHISVINEEDRYYIVDQGSTNGTYVNEERLIPGRRIEFTSFFPVRLGDNTLISLISDDDDDFGSDYLTAIKEKTSPSIQKPVLTNTDATRTISLNELKKVNTQALVKQRDKKRIEVRNKRIPVKKKSSSSIQFVPFLAFCLVLAAAYYNLYVQDNEVPEEKVEQIGKIVPIQPTQNLETNKNLIPESDLTQKESYAGYLNNPKCLIDVEKYLCDQLSKFISGEFGVVQIGTTVHVLLDGGPFFNEVDSFLKNATNDDSIKTNTELRKESVAYLVLYRVFPEVLDVKVLGDNKLSVAIFEKVNNKTEVDTVIAIKPESYNKLRPQMREDFHRFIKSSGVNTFKSAKEYYRIY